jgi:pimeloyl-ACP methyl ester carboxylesterase
VTQAVPVPHTVRVTGTDGVVVAVHRWSRPGNLPPVVLLHGFLTDTEGNWVRSGVVAALLAGGREVIGVDARGHGASSAPRDPESYGEPAMARDVRAVADALHLAEFDLVGYSMGAVVALLVADVDPRVRRLLLGGLWGGVLQDGRVEGRYHRPDDVAAALEADDPPADPELAALRAFAEAQGSDRFALAAHLRCVLVLGPLAVPSVRVPTLVVVGRDDDRAAGRDLVARTLPGAALQVVPGDHLSAAYGPRFAATVVEFLGRPRPGPKGTT